METEEDFLLTQFIPLYCRRSEGEGRGEMSKWGGRGRGGGLKPGNYRNSTVQWNRGEESRPESRSKKGRGGRAGHRGGSRGASAGGVVSCAYPPQPGWIKAQAPKSPPMAPGA